MITAVLSVVLSVAREARRWPARALWRNQSAFGQAVFAFRTLCDVTVSKKTPRGPPSPPKKLFVALQTQDGVKMHGACRSHLTHRNHANFNFSTSIHKDGRQGGGNQIESPFMTPTSAYWPSVYAYPTTHRLPLCSSPQCRASRGSSGERWYMQ